MHYCVRVYFIINTGHVTMMLFEVLCGGLAGLGGHTGSFTGLSSDGGCGLSLPQ